MTPKGSRITVDLGDDELVKKVKIAAVQHGRTVREIVVEALTAWLAAAPGSSAPKGTTPKGANDDVASSDPDYKSMIENLNRYRGVGQ